MASEIPQTRCFLRRRSTVFCKWRSDNLGAPVFFIERPPGKSSSSRHRAANVNPDTPVHRAPGLPLRAFIRKWNARSEEHTSELQSLMRISYAVFCLKKKKKNNIQQSTHI